MIVSCVVEIDLRNLNCPLPLLYTKRALSNMHSGEILKIFFNDSNILTDFQIFSKQTNNTIVDFYQKDGVFTLYLKKR